MIIWGKQYVYSKLGYVGDFCYVCREPRAFELKRVGLAGHVYYVSLTQGDLVGHERRCMTCALVLNATPETYARASKELVAVPGLLGSTFPDFATHYASRLALEKAIKDPFHKLPAGVRQSLIKEPFTLLSNKAEAHYGKSVLNGSTIAVWLGALFVAGILSALVGRFLPDHEGEIAAGVIIVASVAAWYYNHWAGKRLLRREVLEPLAMALRPLKPTIEEITAVLNDMKTLGLKMGKKLKAKAVMEALQPKAG
jgi:hypothetical protein